VSWFTWGDSPTEIGATYAAYRVLGYSDEDAAVAAQEAFLDRPMTAAERAAFVAGIQAEGGVIADTAENIGADIGRVVDKGGKGFFGELGPTGWLVVGGAGLAAVALIVSSRSVGAGAEFLRDLRRRNRA